MPGLGQAKSLGRAGMGLTKIVFWAASQKQAEWWKFIFYLEWLFDNKFVVFKNKTTGVTNEILQIELMQQ